LRRWSSALEIAIEEADDHRPEILRKGPVIPALQVEGVTDLVEHDEAVRNAVLLERGGEFSGLIAIHRGVGGAVDNQRGRRGA